MIHTPIYPDLKREKSTNVASFLYRGRVGYTNGVFIIGSIPHCTNGLETSKETKNQEMWLRFYIETGIWLCFLPTSSKSIKVSVPFWNETCAKLQKNNNKIICVHTFKYLNLLLQ